MKRVIRANRNNNKSLYKLVLNLSKQVGVADMIDYIAEEVGRDKVIECLEQLVEDEGIGDDVLMEQSYDDDTTEFAVSDAIGAMTYSAYDNYSDDPDATYDLILDDVIEHLEAPDLYNLKEGQDFDKLDVAHEMDKYGWDYINESRSIAQWIAEELS